MSAIFLCGNNAVAQKKDWLELLPGAERLSFDETNGVQRLVGKLNFTYQGSILYCDSAHYKPSTKEIWAYSKVHLNKDDTLNLYCDSLYYNGNSKLAKLWGHVRVRDREYKITTDSLEYDTNIDKATYRNGGKLENSLKKEQLTSKFGYFFPNTEESFFSGNVVYKSPDLKVTSDTLQYDYLSHKLFFYGATTIKQKETIIMANKGWYHVETEESVIQGNAQIYDAPRTIYGDSLYYNPTTKNAEGVGHIVVIDTAQHIELHGGYFRSEAATHTDWITRDPWAKMMRTKDTLYLRADTLIHVRDTANKTLSVKGNWNVKIFHGKVQAISQQLDYRKSEGQLLLWGEPHFWSNNSELRGDTLRVFIKNDTVLEKVNIRYNAFAANEVDSGAFYNQLAGKEMWAYFKDQELVKAEAIANARTIYFPTDTIRTDTSMVIKRQGMNRMYCSDLKVYLDSGEVSGVTFFKQPEGVFYPIDQINKEEQFLIGFGWFPALRPKRYQEITGEEDVELPKTER